MQHVMLAWILVIAGTPSTLTDSPELREAVVSYLEERYPGEERTPDGQSTIAGLLYLPESAAVEPLEQAVLKQRLPGTVFYTTTVNTPHYEYPQVETLVSATIVSGRPRFESMLSPVYDESSESFMRQFAGTVVASPSDRRAFVQAIGDLLAAITYCGAVSDIAAAGDEWTAQLWHSGLHWREIRVVFDATGQVVSASLTAPRPRQPRRADRCSEEVAESRTVASPVRDSGRGLRW